MRRALAVAALAATLAGCELQVREDDRLSFLAPPERAVVRLPFVLDWRIEGFAAMRPDGQGRRDAGFFGVFVDRTPMQPGQSLDALAERSDPLCFRAPGCPDREWLEDHGVLTTVRTAVAIEVLDHAAGRPAADGMRRHEVTVVLLDGRGRRIGDSSWTRAFYVRKRS